jgi:hypothetical protein
VRSPRITLAIASAVAAFAFAATARADVSAWAFAGGGAIAWKQPPIDPTAPATSSTKPDLGLQGTMAFDIGAGSSPAAPFIVGGFFRVMPVIGHGTDLALLARVATRGFQTGPFGIALDAGAYQRFWGEQSTGFMGEVAVGGPLGLELRLLGARGTHDALAFGGVLGIDLLRLTVFRGTLLDWWPNPTPGQRTAGAYRSSGAAIRF